jgi:hypothetical protein
MQKVRDAYNEVISSKNNLTPSGAYDKFVKELEGYGLALKNNSVAVEKFK